MEKSFGFFNSVIYIIFFETKIYNWENMKKRKILI